MGRALSRCPLVKVHKNVVSEGRLAWGKGLAYHLEPQKVGGWRCKCLPSALHRNGLMVLIWQIPSYFSFLFFIAFKNTWIFPNIFKYRGAWQSNVPMWYPLVLALMWHVVDLYFYNFLKSNKLITYHRTYPCEVWFIDFFFFFVNLPSCQPSQSTFKHVSTLAGCHLQ